MFQQMTIVGNLGRDPEMRYTGSGAPVTSFSVATSRTWTDNEGNRQEKTTWFKVTAWRKQAEICAQYLKKGSKVLVMGEIDEPSVWTDKEGNSRASLELTAQTVKFLSGKDDGDTGAVAGGNFSQPSDEPSEDIPF